MTPIAISQNITLTKSYIPKVSNLPDIHPHLASFYIEIENRSIHEGRMIDKTLYQSNEIE